MYHVIDLKETGGIKKRYSEDDKKIVGVALYWEE